MRYILFATATLFVSLVRLDAQVPVTVSEPEIRSYLRESATVVMIPVRSQVDHPIGATLTVSWMDGNEAELRRASTQVQVRPGNNRFEVPLPLPVSSIWTRLKYSLAPRMEDARAFAPQAGIVGIGQIADHVFALKATHAGIARPGESVLVHAQAVHPVTREPFENLEWAARMRVAGQLLAPLRT
ncbi:MAG: hypothetical protein QM757_36075, partial [Paludibaculum sp.]